MSAVTSITLVGGYDAAYPRTDVIIKGCEANGVEVRHVHIEWGTPFVRRMRLRRALRKTTVETDFVLVPATCHHEVSVAKKHCSKPVIFDPLFSRYLTKIHDYRSAGRYSLHALMNFAVDKKSLSRADYVLSDTKAHKEYYCRTFGVSEGKVFVVYVGYNSDDFYPVEKRRTGTVTVGFYGSFNPLQGADVIVEAAGELKHRRDIVFEMAGEGHTLADAKERARRHGLENVSFCGHVPYEKLRDTIGRWDICLGIFGSTLKADLVIPNKVYHYAGCRKPIISKRSAAIEEVFTDAKDIALCDAEPLSLANAISRLAADRDLSDTLAQNAHRTVGENYTHVHIGKMLKGLLDQWK